MTFSSNHIRDQWLQVARLRGVARVEVTGDLWVVQTDQAGASAVQKAIGGLLRIRWPFVGRCPRHEH
jgi:hypothetical protein